MLQLITSRKPIHRRFFGRDSVEASCSCNGKFPPFLWEKHISASPMFGFLLHDGYGWRVTLQEIEGSKYPSEFRTGGLHRLQLAVVGRDNPLLPRSGGQEWNFYNPFLPLKNKPNRTCSWTLNASLPAQSAGHDQRQGRHHYPGCHGGSHSGLAMLTPLLQYK